MKKCTNCAKDLPDAAMHCVFCGSKQPAPAAGAPAAGAQAKTVMGWQASDLMKDMQSKGISPPPAASPQPPMGGPPPPAGPPSGPAPVHTPAAVAATLVPATAGQSMGQMAQNPAQAATMFQQGPFSPPGQPQPQPPAPGPAQHPAASAATMFVQGPSPASLQQTIPAPSAMGPPPQQQQPYQQPPPYQQQPPPYQQQPPPYQQQQPPPYQQQPPPYQQQPPPYQQPYGQPQGGYNPVPVGQPMNPPYLASQTAARVGAPVEPYKDGIKLVLIAFGVALLAVFAAPMSIDPLGFRWDLLSSDALDALAKFDHVYFAAAGLLALVFGAVPLATVPRGALAAVLGLVPLAIGLVNHLRGPEVQWQVLVGLGAALTLVPGLLLRNEYRSQMLPRILTTIGAACVFVVYLVPSGGGDPPVVAMFEAIGNVPGKGKVLAILALMPLVLAALSLLVWLPPPTTAGAKVLAWLIIVTGVIIAYVGLGLSEGLGKQIETGFNGKLIAPWAGAAWSAFIGYGLATIFGKGLEHS